MMKIAPILKAMIGEMLNSTQTKGKKWGHSSLLRIITLPIWMYEWDWGEKEGCNILKFKADEF